MESTHTTTEQIRKPKFGRLIETVEEFYKLAKYIAHFAVKRSLGYFHHYIVTGWCSAQETIIEYCVCFSNFLNSIQSGPGEVVENEIPEDIIERDIDNGLLYVIEDPNYPKTDREIKEAKERFLERLGERSYGVTSNNCEHLVTYILTGLPYSEQIRNAGPWTMLIADVIDVSYSHAKSTCSKMLGSLLSVKQVSASVKTAAKEILNVASKKTVNSAARFASKIVVNSASQTATKVAANSASRTTTKLVVNSASRTTTKVVVNSASRTATTASKGAVNLCKFACRNSKYKASEILESTKCVDMANKVSEEALKSTAVATFLVTGAIEAVAAAYEISNLKEKKEKKILSERDYNRDVTKIVCGAVSATVSTVAGGVIGQALCPIPVVGYCVGSFVGNMTGRLIGSVSSGQIFDFWCK